MLAAQLREVKAVLAEGGAIEAAATEAADSEAVGPEQPEQPHGVDWTWSISRSRAGSDASDGKASDGGRAPIFGDFSGHADGRAPRDLWPV